MKEFDLDKLERKNIYKVRESMFENMQDRVLSKVNDLDLELLERKNIYKISDDVFENIQMTVLNDINAYQKAPIFKLSWGYAAAASLALIFGSAFLYNSYSDSNTENIPVKNYTENPVPKKESEIAYETLQSDLTSVENSNQTFDNQQVKAVAYAPDHSKNNDDEPAKKPKTVSKQTEAHVAEYLDSFSNSEIAELANNSTQDVYLDLYN
ncbi:hypothetical protein N0B16_08820 [Chryseobacterium sp. GMJ5]|uniref:Anti sigma-E protein RseA N-terminal domain-containing protein n=1 Tax=Chryseobacterium gilvum TaxID=2976534 RepID=A0ABT2VZR0_9FLAO|nr:hypothetical protein [Chryseobacterium gilvum]MCU7614539.1 hypothetical protein [Chryseobacterium gilvum]